MVKGLEERKMNRRNKKVERTSSHNRKDPIFVGIAFHSMEQCNFGLEEEREVAMLFCLQMVELPEDGEKDVQNPQEWEDFESFNVTLLVAQLMI